MAFFKDLFTNFKTNISRVAQKAGEYAKIAWINIPHLLSGAKVVGNVLNDVGIPIGSAIKTGAEVLQGIYDGVNEFAGIVEKEKQRYSGGGVDNR